ncbi:serine/threonine-protein kinase [Adhaeretor mobilis]|uniref:Serine/threonine-protein kinase PrkC n=1 Tax=Adhaeretor mobilis TaxID=1930276 RepID=A0A517MWR9_9BACT|nr:serine/threonine-protein kinase [Adhaeretor mobilis]QDS99321.1 Serine/threonine-protein kinase PrkC [Adhaeretor mobilis]
MSDHPRTYSALSAEEQAAVSVWIDTFDQSYEYEGAAALKKAVKAAPEELRSVLISQLLPQLIDHDRKRQGRTPTLHELRSRFPDLAQVLSDAYPLLAAGYRLPVELRGYRVLRVVGEGGQAIVLRAQDDMHSAVAIKLSASPKHNELLLRERELLGQCQHPGIPDVIASGVDEDRAFFVMPFLRGMTLADKYATHRPTAEEAVRVATELCGVVDHLHGRGILHRDIKPQNVWLDDSGAVKLIDLGMAIDRSSWGSSRAAITEFHGTPAFMSPEQATADGKQDGELSDLFSIGAVLYWMMTGRPPCAAETQQSSLERSQSGLIDRRGVLRLSSYPKALKKTCLRALEASPQERFASVGELANSLQAKRRSKTSQMTMAALGVALAVGLWQFSEPIGESPPDTDQAADIKRGEAASDPGVPDLTPEADERGSSDREEIAEPPVPERKPETPRPATPGPDDDPGHSPASPPDESLFSVKLKSALRYQEPFGSRSSSGKDQGVLLVQLRDDKTQLPGRIEYRVDDLPWKTLRRGDDRVGFRAFLNADEASKRGPIFLRFVDDTGQPVAGVSGPLSYSYNVARDIKKENDRFVEGLFRNAATGRCMDHTGAGWVIDAEYSERYSTAVRDLLYTNDESKPMRSVARQIAVLIGARGPKDGSRPSYTLKQAFALVSSDVRSSPNLWVKLELRNDKTTEPTLYTRAKVAVRKYEEQATAWFEWLGPEDEAAVFRAGQLSLNGIQNALPRLTHLVIVGEYHGGTSKSEGTLTSNDPSAPWRQSSPMTFDVSKLNGKTTFRLPPIWSSVTIRGRLGNGKTTPGLNIRNHGVSCGVALKPVASSSESCAVEAYLFVAHDQLPVKDLSILRHLPDAGQLPAKAARDCLATRLKLKAMLPPGAWRADFYTDREFEHPLSATSPGMVYVQYTNRAGDVLGDTTYRISPSLFEEWVEHGLGHFHLPGISAFQSKTRGSQGE